MGLQSGFIQKKVNVKESLEEGLTLFRDGIFAMAIACPSPILKFYLQKPTMTAQNTLRLFSTLTLFGGMDHQFFQVGFTGGFPNLY
ncbi:MAG: hypothetical protein ACYCOO_05445 [Chitinophagaceae bacterium]